MAEDFEKKYSFSPLAYYLYLPNLYPGIGTKDGTAKTDKDFKQRYINKVLFHPGQTTASWRVRMDHPIGTCHGCPGIPGNGNG